MSGTLGELLMILIRNQRTMHEFRGFPAEGIIESLVLRTGGKILISPNHMGNPHQMVVHDIGKIIGREAVGLNEHHVIQFAIFHSNIPV